jgi:hypothetical protein
MVKWVDSEIDWLKENYNKSYGDMSVYLGRSKRALKHKIFELGLKRVERRRVTEEEKSCILNNPMRWSKDLARDVGRSEFAVAKLKRKLLGSASPTFKRGWDVPSRELAYFLGVVCSDGGIYKYSFILVQKFSNREMILEIERILEVVFGFKAKIDHIVCNGVQYNRVSIYSSRFLKDLGDVGGIKRGNIRGLDSEWIDFILNKFSWVFKDDYFWYFLGGLYDGDGSLIRKRVNHVGGGIWYEISLAIKPLRSREKIMVELKKRGFIFSVRSRDSSGRVNDVGLKGGQEKVDEFLGLVKCKIKRKKEK